MRNPLLALTPVALMLLAASNSVHAASNAQMVITGNVVAATCDVSLSTPNLDLGNHTATAFTSVATPVAASIKTFILGLNNCQAPPEASAVAKVMVTGQTLGGNPNMFNSSGTNAGVMLSNSATPGTYINAGSTLDIATATATPDAKDINGKVITLRAGLASSVASPDIGMVNAPVLFSFTYN